MTDRDDFLAAIGNTLRGEMAEQGAAIWPPAMRGNLSPRIDGVRDQLVAHVDESLNALASIAKAALDGVEKRLETIETKLGQHETRIGDAETSVKALQAKP